MKAKRLHWRPVLDKHPGLRDTKLLAGYTADETWVCTVDGRDPDGFSGIHADFQFGPKEDYHAHHLPSIVQAKKWCQNAWSEMLSEWIAPATPAPPAGDAAQEGLGGQSPSRE